MTEHDHDTHHSRPAQQNTAPVENDTDDAGHPLLDLQRQAGNAAVARMLAVQRHSLNPEEEASR